MRSVEGLRGEKDREGNGEEREGEIQRSEETGEGDGRKMRE